MHSVRGSVCVCESRLVRVETSRRALQWMLALLIQQSLTSTSAAMQEYRSVHQLLIMLDRVYGQLPLVF